MKHPAYDAIAKMFREQTKQAELLKNCRSWDVEVDVLGNTYLTAWGLSLLIVQLLGDKEEAGLSSALSMHLPKIKKAVKDRKINAVNPGTRSLPIFPGYSDALLHTESELIEWASENLNPLIGVAYISRKKKLGVLNSPITSEPFQSGRTSNSTLEPNFEKNNIEQPPACIEPEPTPILGDKKSQKKWLLWYVLSKGFTENDNFPYGFKSSMVKAAQKHGISDSVMDKRWREIGLKGYTNKEK